MHTLCAATGLRITARPEWTARKLSDSCAITFSITGNNILYSAPVGSYDLEGLRNSILLKNEIKSHLAGGDGPYFQILDYAALKGSTQAVRKIFIRDLNNDNRLQALIFCNLSLPLSTGVKIGKQFISPRKSIHIVNNYLDAIRLALKLCERADLKQDFHSLEQDFCIDGISYSRSQVVLNTDNDWDVAAEGLTCRSTIIDQCTFHSITAGYFGDEHLSAIEHMRYKCLASLPQGSTFKYMVVGSNGLHGMSGKSRLNYMKSLKEWHQLFPFRMYIVYGTNTFSRTAVSLAKPLMPFRIKIAQDFNEALEIIRMDKQGKTSGKQKENPLEIPPKQPFGNIEKLLAFIASLNWEQPGVENSFFVDEHDPFYILYQSIKLIKEEFDSLLNEQRQLTESLQLRRTLIRKQAKNLADSNTSLASEIAERKKAEIELQKHRDHLEEIVAERTKELQTMAKCHGQLVKPCG